MIKPGMFISDRYEIIEKVGSGGMADVYKARCHRLNRFVAIKILKTEYSDDKSFVQKFRAEAQSAAGLSHPNIVNVYDVGDDQGLYYIVMELVEGITLKSFIERKNKLEVREAVGIAIQIAQGMEAAHANHIIHRDIKPQNIIISREGKVKVTDFGIAKAASSNTITSNAMGSVHYISPEQARGGYSDERSDVYSLGITLYEMLSGMVPFAGENTVSVALLHIQGEAMPLREIDPSIPLSLEKIVAKCMEKKPERRYQSASELIADLKRSLRDPSGDFVRVVPTMVDSSPTINITQDELDSIKSQSANKAEQPAKKVYEEPVIKHDDYDEEEEDDDDDDDSEVDPKFEKIIMGVGIGLCVILVVALISFAAKTLGLFSDGKAEVPSEEPGVSASADPTGTADATDEPSTSPEGTKIPDVKGMSLEDAKKELEDYSVRYTEESSEEYDKGKVIKQDPEAGEETSKGSTINLVVSSGANSIKVPNLSEKTQKSGETALKDLGLDFKHSFEFSDDVEKGLIIKTSPASGSSVYKGDYVTIIVSNGPKVKKVSMPNLLGYNEDQARKALEDAGLKMSSNVLKDNSSKYAVDQVMRQSVTAGKEIEEGSEVTITLSLGALATPTPAPSFRAYGSLTGGYLPDAFTSANVTLKFVQNGSSKTIISQIITADQIPFNFKADSNVGGEAVVEVYVDGVNTGSIPINLVQQ